MSWPPEKGFLQPYDFGKVDRQWNFLDWPTSLAATAPPQLEDLSPLFVVPPGLMNSPGYLSPLPSPFWMPNFTAQAQVLQAEYQHSGEVSSEVSQSAKRTAKVARAKPADDGYEWIRYTQTRIKTTGCCKRYYKCAHVSCPVKKHVERFSDGRVNQIRYIGQHNHDPPNTVSTSQCLSESERLNEGITVADDEDPVEVIAKRSSLEAGTGTKIVLRIKCEVHVLDDGYKWIKYGTTRVKGNPNLRRCYKCSETGCNVRKRVVQASDDPESVIAEYDGKHNHDVPVDKSAEGGVQESIDRRRRNRFM